MVSYSTLIPPEYQQSAETSHEIMRVAHKLVPRREEQGRAILVTSVLPQEGKSLVLRHLAVACGTLLDQHVLIGDLSAGAMEQGSPYHSSPSHYSYVGMPPHLQELGEHFSQEFQAPHTIEPTLHPHIKRLETSMASGNVYRFLEAKLPDYREEYRLVLLEAPSLRSSQSPDPVLLSSLFDHVIVVLQPQRTPLDEVQESLSLLKKNSSKNISLMLNRTSHGVEKELNSPWAEKLTKIPFLKKLVSYLQGSNPKARRRGSPVGQEQGQPHGWEQDRLSAQGHPSRQDPSRQFSYPSIVLDEDEQKKNR